MLMMQMKALYDNLFINIPAVAMDVTSRVNNINKTT